MRNLTEIIDKMMELIPGDQATNAALIDRLASIRASAFYGAPEVQYIFWQKAAVVLEDNLPQELEQLSDWQRQVVELFNGEPLEPQPFIVGN